MNLKTEFRNILTTGNVISAMATAFIAGGAWFGIQNDIKAHTTSIDKLEKNEIQNNKDLMSLKISVTKIESTQQYDSQQLQDIKEWLKRISERQR